MSYDALGAAALNYTPCRYGNARVRFRGPARRMDTPYLAFVGGSETYGRFVKAPFPALIESDLGINCINFGVLNAGLDVFVNEGFFSEAASGAVATVLQVVGTQNMSNRFYTVHPRRNDRFLDASAMLKTIYPEVDFSEFHFTRHMLSKLYEVSRERFSIVRRELQIAWAARMKMLLRRFEGDVILLWFAETSAAAEGCDDFHPTDNAAPLFVTREMLSDLSVYLSGFVEVPASDAALAAGTKGMVFNEMEAPAAEKSLGPKAHGEVALALGPVLGALARKKGRF